MVGIGCTSSYFLPVHIQEAGVHFEEHYLCIASLAVFLKKGETLIPVIQKSPQLFLVLVESQHVEYDPHETLVHVVFLIPRLWPCPLRTTI